MKKTSILKVLTILSALSGVTPSFGQLAENSNKLNPLKLKEASRAVLSAGESSYKELETLKEMNVKMHRDFTKFFKNASEIRTTQNNQHIFIHFMQSGIKCRATYNKKGRWVSTLKFLKVDQIPMDIRRAVANAYPCFQILRSLEVIVGPNSAHLVDLEDNQSFKKIRVIDGELDVYQELSKN